MAFNLPNRNMSFSPLEVLEAQSLNKMVENDQAMAQKIDGLTAGEGLNDGAIKSRHLEKNKKMGEALIEIGALGIGEQAEEFAIGWGLNITVYKVGRIVYWQITGVANCGRDDRIGERIPDKYIPMVETIISATALNSGNEHGTGLYRFRTDGSIGRWGATGHNEWLGSGCYIARA